MVFQKFTNFLEIFWKYQMFTKFLLQKTHQKCSGRSKTPSNSLQSSVLLDKVSIRLCNVQEGAMRSQKSPQGSTIFPKVPSVAMKIHRLRVSEGLWGLLRFSRVLSGSPMFFEGPLVLFQGSSRSPQVLHVSVVVLKKVLNGPLWLNWASGQTHANWSWTGFLEEYPNSGFTADCKCAKVCLRDYTEESLQHWNCMFGKNDVDGMGICKETKSYPIADGFPWGINCFPEPNDLHLLKTCWTSAVIFSVNCSSLGLNARFWSFQPFKSALNPIRGQYCFLSLTKIYKIQEVTDQR